MAKAPADRIITFSQPIRQILSMLISIGLAAGGAWLIRPTVVHILDTNPMLNAFILGVFTLGIVTCFWQVFILMQSVNWIERFLNNAPGAEEATPPTLLAPRSCKRPRQRGAKMQVIWMSSMVRSSATGPRSPRP